MLLVGQKKAETLVSIFGRINRQIYQNFSAVPVDYFAADAFANTFHFRYIPYHPVYQKGAVISASQPLLAVRVVGLGKNLFNRGHLQKFPDMV